MLIQPTQKAARLISIVRLEMIRVAECNYMLQNAISCVIVASNFFIKEVTTMTTAVRITDDLVRDAKIYSKIDKRSITGQIEHWARIGKCAEENPDLTYSLIKDILIGIAELEQGESSEYKFG